ncbi:MAG: ribose 5-phosphate isomerase B [Proteobacteria bacterium]|nr:ribose 5-phosphate isomerase B [Pseudomonadota bacterium]
MRWVLASDHAAVDMRQALAVWLKDHGAVVTDLGPQTADSVDYPDKANELAAVILSHQADFGVLLCGTGIGVSIRANRYPGIRAALVHDTNTAHLARAHNNANVLCMGGRVLDIPTAIACLETFYTTDFEGGRHARRVEKLDKKPE